MAYRNWVLAGASIISLQTPAYAQDTLGEQAQSDSEIIVRARRRDESVQDVPQTVNVVVSDVIEKLRLNNASDLTQVVPGISIEGGTATSGAFGSSSSIRGVPTFATQNATPVVQFYLNDAPTGSGPGPAQIFFDLGQVEVLKGPQGTLRGRSAPTGAITITTRAPDLADVSGYANMSGTSRGNINLQGAVGIPLIKDVLALRIAGAVDHNEGSSVTSVNYGGDPYVKTEAVRGTLLFEPTPNFSANLMYQRLWRKGASYQQLVGPGNGRNGPPLRAEDRRGISDGPATVSNDIDVVIGQINWSFGGQKLSYVGSYRDDSLTSISIQDTANIVRGVEIYQTSVNEGDETSHELRLSSDERVLGAFDYTVGLFYDKSKSNSDVVAPARFLSGAFGRPGTAPVEAPPLGRYSLFTDINVAPVSEEKSVFGNVTAHIGESTELSAGGRYLVFERRDRFNLGLRGGFNALANPTRGLLPCENLGALSAQLRGAVASPVYTGAPSICDLPIPGAQLQDVDRRSKYKPFLYNLSASHKFTPDFMIYGNVGTAFRSAGPRIGFTSVLTCCTQVGGPNLGSIEDLVFQDRERSTTYEVGFKSTFFDKRARLNVAVFKQDYDNYYFQTQPVQYLSVTDPRSLATGQVSSAEFSVGGDATVKGVDVEAFFQVTPRWNVNLGFTYAKATLNNALVPCNDSNFDGVADAGVATIQGFINAGTLVARCRSNESISRSPRWNLTVQSEYAAPVTDTLEGFIRGNFNYFPDNPNASQTVEIDQYSLLNVFLGLRGPEAEWEVSLFANNLLNTSQILSYNAVAQVSAGSVASFFPQGASGYNQVSYTPRREFGLLVRYAFGGR